MKRFLLIIALWGAASVCKPVSVSVFAQQPDEQQTLRERIFGGRQVELHTVNFGETAYSIARRYGVLLSEMMAANPDSDLMRLAVGQRIRIPRRAIGKASTQQIDADFAQYTTAPPQAGEPFAVRPDTLLLWDEADNGQAGGWTDVKAGYSDGHQGDRPVRSFDGNQPLRVALLLPFTEDGRQEVSMADYYRGTLLGLQDLKESGISVDLSVFDTQNSTSRVRDILWDLNGVDLIIGPRNGEPFDEAARFAFRAGIPIVSPQSLVEGGNPCVFQARPAPEYQYEKLEPYLTDDHHVVLIVPAEGVDDDFLTQIEKILPAGTMRVDFAGRGSASAIRNALSRERENIVVVPTLNENITEDILPTISSIQNNITATTGRGYSLQIIGSPQWARFRNNDSGLFFKLQAMYPTLYYADRTNRAVGEFEGRYLEAFGMLPSLFSYRGYDVAKLFVTAVHDYGSDYDRAINRVNTPLLQVPYHFRRDESGKWVNDQWVLVRYRSDYIIEVE